MFTSSSQCIHMIFLMRFQHVPKFLMCFPNVPNSPPQYPYRITFAQSWITYVDRLKGSKSIIMFWKCQFILGVGLFKFQNFTFFNFYCLKRVLDSFWNNLGSTSQLLNRNNNRWPRSYDCNESQLDIGVSIMDPHMKRHVIFRPHYTPYRLWV